MCCSTTRLSRGEKMQWMCVLVDAKKLALHPDSTHLSNRSKETDQVFTSKTRRERDGESQVLILRGESFLSLESWIIDYHQPTIRFLQFLSSPTNQSTPVMCCPMEWRRKFFMEGGGGGEFCVLILDHRQTLPSHRQRLLQYHPNEDAGFLLVNHSTSITSTCMIPWINPYIISLSWHLCGSDSSSSSSISRVTVCSASTTAEAEEAEAPPLFLSHEYCT